MTAKLSPKTPLTVREKKFIKNYIDTGKIGQSALRAGYADRQYGSQLMRQEKVLRAIETALQEHGITDEYVARKLREGCEATYPERRSKDGNVLQPESPDFFTRGQYLEKVIKIRGDYAPEKLEVEHREIKLNINVDTVQGLLDADAITDVEAEEIKTAGVLPEVPKELGP